MTVGVRGSESRGSDWRCKIGSCDERQQRVELARLEAEQHHKESKNSKESANAIRSPEKSGCGEGCREETRGRADTK